MRVFISYSTIDKTIAGKIQKILKAHGINSFLAHENIQVSHEWQNVILDEIGKADVFIGLLSKNYQESPWCLQESGIAVFQEITLILLSIDETIPKGFLGKTQSAKIKGTDVTIFDLLPGIIKFNLTIGTNLIINMIGKSKSFRDAESNFKIIIPYLKKLTEKQIKELIKLSVANPQIYKANLCTEEYIPKLLKGNRHLLTKKQLSILEPI